MMTMGRVRWICHGKFYPSSSHHRNHHTQYSRRRNPHLKGPESYEAAVRRMLRRKQVAGTSQNRHSKQPIASRRRQLYRPVVMGDEEYEDYDAESPLTALRSRRPPQIRGPRLRLVDDRLWPIAAYSVGRDGKPRVYGNNAYEPENQSPLKVASRLSIVFYPASNSKFSPKTLLPTQQYHLHRSSPSK